MSWDLVLRHCAVLRASVTQTRVSLELIDSQVSGLQAYAQQQHERETKPTARIERPASCAGVLIEDCGRLNDEAAQHVGGFGGTEVMCRGCGLNPLQTVQ